ncbi:faciogenital dysplasia protein [Anaeramoeba flamelloides]|uniref:Faciogenital dysplasia protein n=1 Tax=Anaeramoeba flamelloides TaxID=1746091 RepID=A0AAV7Z580_9EUKA|nr:faciogenital dysplasia protein [Anaeramoeba flamelloides]
MSLEQNTELQTKLIKNSKSLQSPTPKKSSTTRLWRGVSANNKRHKKLYKTSSSPLIKRSDKKPRPRHTILAPRKERQGISIQFQKEEETKTTITTEKEKDKKTHNQSARHLGTKSPTKKMIRSVSEEIKTNFMQSSKTHKALKLRRKTFHQKTIEKRVEEIEKKSSNLIQISRFKKLIMEQVNQVDEKNNEIEVLKETVERHKLGKLNLKEKIFKLEQANKDHSEVIKSVDLLIGSKNIELEKKASKVQNLVEEKTKIRRFIERQHSTQKELNDRIETLSKELKEQEKKNQGKEQKEKELNEMVHKLRQQLKETQSQTERQNNLHEMEKTQLHDEFEKEKTTKDKIIQSLTHEKENEKKEYEKIVQEQVQKIKTYEENLQNKTNEFERYQQQMEELNNKSNSQERKIKKKNVSFQNYLIVENENFKITQIPKLKTKVINWKKQSLLLKKNYQTLSSKNKKLLMKNEIQIKELTEQSEEKDKKIKKLETRMASLTEENKSYETELKEKEKEIKIEKIKNEELKQMNLIINSKLENFQQIESLRLEEENQETTNYQEYIEKMIIAQTKLRTYLQQKKYNKSYQRVSICKEIYVTEKEYVVRIKLLLENFLEPLKQFTEIPVKEINQIITELTIILSLSRKILMNLKNKIPKVKINSKELIGKVFAQFSAAMLVYTTYVNRYSSFDSTIRENITKNVKLKNFLSEKKLQCDLKLGLFDLLISPVQRIPKYSLLLKSLKKNTLNTHPDYNYIDMALKQIVKQAEILNKKRKQFSNLNQLFEISQKIHHNDNNNKNDQEINLLNKPSRKFIWKTKITHFSEKIVRSRIAILFNDLLIFVKLKNPYSFFNESKDNYYYNLKFSLFFNKPLKIIDLKDEKLGDHLIEIQSPNLQNNLIFKVENEKEKSKWIRKLNKLNNKQIQKSRNLNASNNKNEDNNLKNIEIEKNQEKNNDDDNINNKVVEKDNASIEN